MSIFLLIYSRMFVYNCVILSSISAITVYFSIVALGDCIVLKGSGENPTVLLELSLDRPTLRLSICVISDLTLCERCSNYFSLFSISRDSILPTRCPIPLRNS